MQLPCLKVTALHFGSGCGLKLGRQAAWRLGAIGMVSSSWLAALCRQLLCLKVTAWRPGTFGMVSSSWLAALCKQYLLCFKSNCEVLGLWLRAQTRSSSCLAAGCNRNGVVKLVGGTLQAVAVFKSDYEVLGALTVGSNSVVKLLGGRVQSGWCRQVGWRLCASSRCSVIVRFGLWLRDSERLAAGPDIVLNVQSVS